MISTEQKEIILSSLKPYSPKFVGVFGSYARNQEHNDSDLDLLLSLAKPNLSLFDIGALYDDLEKKLQIKIDLSFKHKLKKSLEPFILKDLITIYEA